jgi:hypothetical protein
MRNAILILFYCLWCTATHASAVLPDASPYQTVGTVNCASSTCHGLVVPRSTSRILQNEYTTWLRLDKHAKAYSALLSEQSRQIVQNLDLKQPAWQIKVCLDCHANNAPAELKGQRHILSDGVGCEACHGPAAKWLATHTMPGTTHQDNINNGMYPVDRPVAQAKLCLSCHFGDEDRFVTHRMMAAGHPRLSFEIDMFDALQPPHYRTNGDSVAGKGAADSVTVWAIGQALASQQLLRIFSDPTIGRDGLFPELVLFDCNACHHPMSMRQSSTRLGNGPGRVHLNDSNLLMLRAIVAVIEPAHIGEFDEKIAQLHHAIAGNKPSGQDAVTIAKQLCAAIDGIIIQIEMKPPDVTILNAVLNELMNEASIKNYSDYAGAEQAYMSVSSLISSLNKRRVLKNVAEINLHLTALRATLAHDEKYNPEAFKSAFIGLRLALFGKESGI